MNDEELRAFLDSATVGGEKDQGQESGAAASEQVAPAAVSDGSAPRRRGVPSFDELMSMGEPVSHAAPEPAAASQPEPKAQPWEQTFATEDEQLVPLILPGFSPEHRERRELPPVFQAESVQRLSPDKPAEQYDEPSPTQPFDVLSGEAAADGKTAPAQGTAAQSRPQPEPAAAAHPRAALAPELAVGAAVEPDYEYERISVTGGENRGRRALPWLIVGGGVAVAVVAAVFMVNGVRGSHSPAEPESGSPAPAPVAEAPVTTDTPKVAKSPEPEQVPEPDAAPEIDPGDTWQLPISQWEVTVQVSEKLGGSTPYTLFDGNTRATFDSIPVASGFSEACAAAREPNVWGLLKRADGNLEVVRPEPRCTAQADAALYDTIWGALEYMAKSVKPV